MHTSFMSDPDPDSERILCDPNVCVISACRDSDNDAICDIDEEALETDPEDHFDRPDFRDVLRKFGERQLPSFQEGRSMIVVLPTVGPDGQAVFGGADMLPARHDLLKTIGIELPSGGPDLSSGFSLVRSLESANVVEYSRPPWTKFGPPTPDTTRDAGADVSSMGTALEGLHVTDFKFDNMTSGDYRFSTFTFNANGNAWTGSSQSGPGSSTTTVETHHKNELDSYELDKTITSTTTISPGGNQTVVTTTATRYVSPDGKLTVSNKKVTKATSADGTEHAVETEENGVKVTDHWIDGFKPEPYSTENAGDFPDPPEGSGYAFMDPDYVELAPSAEAIDAALLMRGGPVRIVDPLSENGGETFIPGIENNGVGPVSLIAPDAASTSITEPLFIHLPFGGDYDPDGAQNGPTPNPTNQNGQCLYCNQGGN